MHHSVATSSELFLYVSFRTVEFLQSPVLDSVFNSVFFHERIANGYLASRKKWSTGTFSQLWHVK